MSVRVLVVEDEELASEAHAAYVGRVGGFELAGVARSAGEAMRVLAGDAGVDLLLLDMHLPDGHGLALLQRIRAAGHLCDVIAVTSARDSDVVRRAVSQGVVLYLLKPFSFAAFRTKLEQYAAYREQLRGTADDVVQDDVDQLFGALRARGTGAGLPKGMSLDSLRQVTDALRRAPGPMSATEVGEAIGASRVTARRYLEHLADDGSVDRAPRYGGTGRPEVAYAWRR
ncbi:Response regulator of citrate/malate metabolism [Nocardioides scoriae]|uniref:Transcriptional regulatory protein n=1 Tax=Nocardioides scoriae TaxID=642780 RepID=A0A1H1MSC3_9ACTN|nr:response regulator [Nocardioides scoriae]SDR89813.1 Response regulator of citrate/malate metabolism [Nocardioides scoriae]